MVECKVLKKYKDASLDSKTLEKGTIVEYELEKAEKLQKSGYVKIVGDVTPITSEVEEPEETVTEDKEEQKSEEVNTDDEQETEEEKEEQEPEETNTDNESEEDNESDDEKEIEMATMPKKYKKKK